ncbi:MAG: metallophosphoesterase [archaeon]
MKILAAGDIHGDTNLARQLAEKANKENVDLVILCGDLTERDKNADNLIGLFKQKLLLIPGNHESLATIDFLAERYKAKNLHGYSIRVDNVGLFGCGLAHMGLSQITEEEMMDLLRKGHKYVENCNKKIMVTHVPPSGIIGEKLSQFVSGSNSVKKALEELAPDILFCSHIHEAEGMEEMVGNTRVINVGRKGKILEV